MSRANRATGVHDPASRRAGQDESGTDGVLKGNQITANSGSDSTPAVSSSSLQSPASDFSEQPRPSEPPLQTQLSTVCSRRNTSASGEDASDGRSKSGQTVGTGFMQSSGTSLLEAQQSDPAIHRVVELKLAQQRLSRRQAAKESGVVRKLLHVWDQLAVKDDLLVYRKDSGDSGGRQFLLVLPRVMRTRVLQHIHNSMGHLGFEKVLQHAKDRYMCTSGRECTLR